MRPRMIDRRTRSCATCLRLVVTAFARRARDPVPSRGSRTCRQPATGSQVSIVQGSLSSQLSGTPGSQVPVDALHVSLPLQTLPSSQTTAAPPHVPPRQTSPVVHALPSSHGFVLFT